MKLKMRKETRIANVLGECPLQILNVGNQIRWIARVPVFAGEAAGQAVQIEHGGKEYVFVRAALDGVEDVVAQRFVAAHATAVDDPFLPAEGNLDRRHVLELKTGKVGRENLDDKSLLRPSQKTYSVFTITAPRQSRSSATVRLHCTSEASPSTLLVQDAGSGKHPAEPRSQ